MKFIVIVAICFCLSFFSVLDLGCNHVNEQHEKIIRIDVLENLDGLQWGYLCLYSNDSSNNLKYGFTKDTMQIEDQVFDQLKNRINNSTFKVNYTNKKYSDRDPIKKDMVYITVIYNDENGLVKDGLIFIFPEDALNFFSLFEDVLSNEDILRVWSFLKFKLDKKLPSFEDISNSQDTTNEK